MHIRKLWDIRRWTRRTTLDSKEDTKRQRIEFWMGSGLTIVGVILLLVGIIGSVMNNGLGIEEQRTTIKEVVRGQEVVQEIEVAPGKTLWDWLQLLVVPAVLTGVGLSISQRQQGIQLQVSKEQKEVELSLLERQKAAELALLKEQKEADLQMLQENQEEMMLQAYLDRMSDLIEKGLFEENKNQRLKQIARSRTLTVLSRLNGERKASVLQFLYESELINAKKWIVSLQGSNVREVNLEETDLRGAKLSGVDLRGARLLWAKLRDVDLRGAKLSGVDLRLADLEGAKLSGADLRGARLLWAKLKGADLRGAKLLGTDLFGVDLEGAKLSGAAFIGADLREAKLSEADFTNAQINEHTNFTDARIEGAIGLVLSHHQRMQVESEAQQLLTMTPSQSKTNDPPEDTGQESAPLSQGSEDEKV